jgi:hypothetical protein
MRQVWFLGAALTAALAGSYVTWTSDAPNPEDAEKVAVYRADKNDVQKIVWKSKDSSVTLERKSDEFGPYTWVTVTEKPGPKIKPPGDTDAPPVPDAPEKTTAFKGNDAADKLWESFGPLLALREIDTQTADKAVFGFAEPFANLEITRNAGAVAMVVGGETWGAKDRYVEADQRVFLVDDADIKPLQFGKTRLVERGLQPLATPDLEKVSLHRGSDEMAFVQQNKDDAAKAFWARSTTPDVKDDGGSTWIDKVTKLKVQSYVAADETPATLEPVFDLAFEGKGKRWTVEVLRGGTAEAKDYFAKSSFDRGLVKLTRSIASDVVADVDGVISGQAAPAEPTTPAAPTAPAETTAPTAPAPPAPAPPPKP